MGRVHGTFRRGTWHTKRKMKSFTDFLLVGFVTMLWSTSVNGDGNAPNATGVLGYDENYCSGKPDGVFCKARREYRHYIRYNHGECCNGRCIEDAYDRHTSLHILFGYTACERHETCRSFEGNGRPVNSPVNTPCRFKNANNEYEDGTCCFGLCSPTPLSCNMDGPVGYDEQNCVGQLEGDKCDYYELGYDRSYHIVPGKCCDLTKLKRLYIKRCVRDFEEC